MVKIYTKTGDRGETGLIGGKRVSKGSARIEAYGDVDELNAVIGVCVGMLDAGNKDVADLLTAIQGDLFVAGADLASPVEHEKRKSTPRIRMAQAENLECLIDRFEEALPPLETFILPSGSVSGSWLHLARTVCRRAERKVVRLSSEEKIGEAVLIYLNRLSDLLFVFARTVNARQNVREIPWISPPLSP